MRDRPSAGVAAPLEPDIVEPGLAGPAWKAAARRIVPSSSDAWKLLCFGVFIAPVLLPLPVAGCDASGMKRDTSSSSCSRSSAPLQLRFERVERIDGAGEPRLLCIISSVLILLTSAGAGNWWLTNRFSVGFGRSLAACEGLCTDVFCNGCC